MSVSGSPTRLQKRWSGRLRTSGALLLLMAAVALADRLFDLGSPASPWSPLDRVRAPMIVVGVLLVLGATLFALGKKWR